jgi:hypothetical protein
MKPRLEPSPRLSSAHPRILCCGGERARCAVIVLLLALSVPVVLRAQLGPEAEAAVRREIAQRRADVEDAIARVGAAFVPMRSADEAERSTHLWIPNWALALAGQHFATDLRKEVFVSSRAAKIRISILTKATTAEEMLHAWRTAFAEAGIVEIPVGPKLVVLVHKDELTE